MDQELSQLVASTEKALEVFYSTSQVDDGLKTQAHQALSDIRSSPRGGQLAWLLLSDMTKPTVVHFFAATALREHINREWDRMEKDQQQGYRVEIFKVLATYCQAERYLHVQLCVTAADILLRAGSRQDDEVVVMVDVLKLLEATPGWPSVDAYKHMVIGLLTVVPEEFSSIDISGTHRNSLRCSLQQAIPAVLELLSNLLDASFASSLPMTVQIIKCFTSWAKFGIPLNEMAALLPTFFQATAKEELFEDCVELLCETIINGDSFRFPSAVRYFMSLMVGTYGQFEVAAAEGRMEFCRELSRIVIAVGENHCKLLVEWSTPEEMNTATQFVKYAVHCSTLPGRFPVDEETTEGMLYFWFRFYEEVDKINKPEVKQMLWPSAFRPLLLAILAKVEIPSAAATDNMCASDVDAFYSFRADAADTCMYISRLYFNECMEVLHGALSRLVSSATSSWQPAEAVLYVLRTCDDTTNHYEEMSLVSSKRIQGLVLLEQIFRELVGRLPDNARLRQTLYRLFCSYSEWLRHHADLVGPVLSVLVEGLQEGTSSATMSTAANGLWDICSECQEHIVPYLDQLVAVCERPSLSQFPKCRVRLVEAICRVISTLAADHCSYYTQRFVRPHLEQLRGLATAGVSSAVQDQLVVELCLLKAIVHRIDPECEDYCDLSDVQKQAVMEAHPIRLVVADDVFWQIMARIFQQWSSSVPVMQAACGLLQRLTLTLQEGVMFRVDQMQVLLVQVLDLSVIAFSLEVTTQLLWMQSSCEAVPLSLRQLVAYYSPLLQMLTAEPSANPDVTLLFLKMVSRVLKCFSDWVLSADCILDANVLFTFLQSCIAVAEVAVADQACTALVSYIDEISKRELAGQLWENSSGLMLGNLLSALLRSMPGRQCHSLCNVLFALYKHFPLQMKSSLEAVFSSIPPFVHVASEEKRKFLEVLPRERTNRRVARDGVAAFMQVVNRSL